MHKMGEKTDGLNRDLNPGPLAPKARIIPLDHWAIVDVTHQNHAASSKQVQGHTNKNCIGSGGIRTHASEETGALNQRLRPLGHAT